MEPRMPHPFLQWNNEYQQLYDIYSFFLKQTFYLNSIIMISKNNTYIGNKYIQIIGENMQNYLRESQKEEVCKLTTSFTSAVRRSFSNILKK